MHLAQVNVSRLLAPLSSPQLSGFVAAADPIEAAGLAAPGFVWRAHVEVPLGAASTPSAHGADERTVMVPKGHRSRLVEAAQRLRHLRAHGPTPYAFTSRQPRFLPDEAATAGG